MATRTVPQQGLSTEAIDPDHKLERGDQLSYRVQEDRDDKVSELVVTATGEVQLPLGGRVKAVGKSTRELASDIKSQLEREYYYHATVDLGFISVAQRHEPRAGLRLGGRQADGLGGAASWTSRSPPARPSTRWADQSIFRPSRRRR